MGLFDFFKKKDVLNPENIDDSFVRCAEKYIGFVYSFRKTHVVRIVLLFKKVSEESSWTDGLLECRFESVDGQNASDYFEIQKIALFDLKAKEANPLSRIEAERQFFRRLYNDESVDGAFADMSEYEFLQYDVLLHQPFSVFKNWSTTMRAASAAIQNKWPEAKTSVGPGGLIVEIS